ncbi:MAG: hypothetical protein H6Q90_1775 [Deltaproteobacteria bacterium]|nr:hypothetical protein [Deltaproteobacteria bacterium]
MGMQTIAKVAESFDGMFECGHCALEVPATVYARSSGTARGAGAQAQALALENAEMDANALASRTLQFVRCPRCGKTDPTGPSYRIQATIGAIVLGAISAVLSYLLVAMRTRGTADAAAAKWVAIGFGVFMVLLLYWKWGRPWRSPDKRTVFH